MGGSAPDRRNLLPQDHSEGQGKYEGNFADGTTQLLGETERSHLPTGLDFLKGARRDFPGSEKGSPEGHSVTSTKSKSLKTKAKGLRAHEEGVGWSAQVLLSAQEQSRAAHHDRYHGPQKLSEQCGTSGLPACARYMRVAMSSVLVPLPPLSSVTQGPSRLHVAAHTCSGSHNQLSPSAVVSLCPFLASNANLSLLFLEAPPACHPLPSPSELALGSELWQIFANGHPRLTKNAAWGSAQKLHTGVHSNSPEDSQTHRSLWPLDTSHDGPWKPAPPPPGQLLPLFSGGNVGFAVSTICSVCDTDSRHCLECQGTLPGRRNTQDNLHGLLTPGPARSRTPSPPVSRLSGERDPTVGAARLTRTVQALPPVWVCQGQGPVPCLGHGTYQVTSETVGSLNLLKSRK